jgi:hypothetical protein
VGAGAAGIGGIVDYFVEVFARQVLQPRTRGGVAEEGFRRHHDQRLLKISLHLPAERVEEVRRPPGAVVDAVAGRTRRPAPDVAALLYGSAPADDAALVRLADDLDALEREVRRP